MFVTLIKCQTPENKYKSIQLLFVICNSELLNLRRVAEGLGERLAKDEAVFEKSHTGILYKFYILSSISAS